MSIGARILGVAVVGALGVARGAVDFQFSYSDVGTGFNDPTLGATRRGALEAAGDTLASYFTGSTATVNITVSSFNLNSGTLASAGSPMLNVIGAQRTVVQEKIITGVDMNNGSADGSMNVNFFHAFGYTDSVPAGSYDFVAVAIHELMHTLGFSSRINSLGQGVRGLASGSQDVWSVYDMNLTTATGAPLITPDFRYDTTVGTAVLTADPGVYFSGANAMAAYGGRVPIYTPASFQQGSSLSHVDELLAVGGARFLMNPSVFDGLATRALNSVELGILADIGYTVVPEGAEWGMIAGLGLVLFAIGRRRLAVSGR